MLEPPAAPEPSLAPHYRVFTVEYDRVWRATQKALAAYPLRTNNIDQGVLETDFVKHGQVWEAPFPRDRKQLVGRYSLKVKVTKGKVGGQESMRVTLIKFITHEKDFFSGEDRRPSDGYEESAVLYRIERELDIESVVIRKFEEKNL